MRNYHINVDHTEGSSYQAVLLQKLSTELDSDFRIQALSSSSVKTSLWRRCATCMKIKQPPKDMLAQLTAQIDIRILSALQAWSLIF